ncbi:hypothetical protein BASA61_010471 [Batrachochytrium salamandrivorans]|nr:hypothetical protein BASA62_005345 [Batrachochytrium salamandrivorans]KAH6579169.1 hypothetical protein BASA61_010471 [Batrachochytrium salamandrivorans]KAH9271355.1 hypothetical protein BASA83_006446 [Batrachochytrium salamandrivorans]
MKLAIASTTLLFAMMAAQAAVLSATSNTGVNLAKRAPNGDDETGQGPTVDQSSSVPAPQTPLTEHEKSRVEELHVRVRNRMDDLKHMIDLKQTRISEIKEHIGRTKQECEKKPSFVRIRARAKIAEFKKTLVELEEKLVEFEQQLKTVMEKYKKTTDVYLGLNQARRLQSYGLLRQYIRNQ